LPLSIALPVDERETRAETGWQ